MPILGIIASQDYNRVTNSYESIATVTVGSGGQSTIEFTSIPSTYKHLQIRWICRDNRVGDASDSIVRFNSDTGSNYSWHQLIGDGVSAASYATTSQTSARVGFQTGTTSGSNVFGATVIDILDYANTNKYKTMRNLAGFDMNTNGSIALNSALWMSTSAITSIVFAPRLGSLYSQYTQFALYGIKS